MTDTGWNAIASNSNVYYLSRTLNDLAILAWCSCSTRREALYAPRRQRIARDAKQVPRYTILESRFAIHGRFMLTHETRSPSRRTTRRTQARNLQNPKWGKILILKSRKVSVHARPFEEQCYKRKYKDYHLCKFKSYENRSFAAMQKLLRKISLTVFLPSYKFARAAWHYRRPPRITCRTRDRSKMQNFVFLILKSVLLIS